MVVAARVQVVRVGPMHQAGSDSLLTSAVFFKLIDVFFGGRLDETKHVGILYGLGSSAA
jgi:CCR4-NOT transcription complex subunit 7/8